MEVEQSKLISNISLNNTNNNNSGTESNQLCQSNTDHLYEANLSSSENIIIDMAEHETKDEVSNLVSESGPLYVMEDSNVTSMRQNKNIAMDDNPAIINANSEISNHGKISDMIVDNIPQLSHLNPQIEFCFCNEDPDTILPKDKSDNYTKCDNRNGNGIITTAETEDLVEQQLALNQIDDKNLINSAESSGTTESSHANMNDGKSDISHKQALDISSISPSKTNEDISKKCNKNMNSVTTADNDLVEKHQLIEDNIEETSSGSLVHSNHSSKSSIVNIDDEKGDINVKELIEYCDNSPPSKKNKNDLLVNRW